MYGTTNIKFTIMFVVSGYHLFFSYKTHKLCMHKKCPYSTTFEVRPTNRNICNMMAFFQTVLMTEEIMQSFRELLTATEWIDNETKELAVQKLDAMQRRIGYPDFSLDPQLLNQRYKDVRNRMFRSETDL
jgi:methionine salvage enolase-phosphatase E1